MIDRMNRRQAIGLLAAAPVAIGPLTAIASDDPRLGDIVMGDENAPVTVIEYASFTCPHCARFHTATWPEFKANYIDTGKVRFIMREVYFDRFGLWASMVSRCGGRGGYYPMVDQFLKTQDKWARAPQDQIADEIRKVGKLNGLSDQALQDCLGDQDFAKALFEDFRKNAEDDDVNSTPTFIINGEKATGNMSYAQFSALVDSHL
ncbi:MAG: DsbA family protein [Pseudomonadota bacterium]